MNRLCIIAMIAMVLVFVVFPLGWAQDTKKSAQVAKKPAEQGDLKTLVQENNEFAFDLYARLSKEKGNKVFSPYSISTALGMTYAGAKGNTAKEMAQTLHFTLDNEHLHPAFGNLIRKIHGTEKPNHELAVANSLWANTSDLGLDPGFLRTMQTDYQAGFHYVDFINDLEGARRSINGWVKEKTKNKVTDLIAEKYISRQTRLILVNAIYFKADWSVPFPKAATKLGDFSIPDKTAFKVPMMSNTLVASYMEDSDFQLAQFKYKDNHVSMVVILPKKMDGLLEVEKKLSAKSLDQALVRLAPAELRVTLPRFKIIEEFSLSEDLKELGMKDAFIKQIADFTGMEMKRPQEESLFISAVVHKAFVEVNEHGTEAAAGSGVLLDRPNSTVEPPAPIVFRADHPFLFILRHNETGSILMMGRINEPQDK